MIHKWIIRGIITLIGLNLLTGCNIFGWTPPEEWFEEVYRNQSSKKVFITLVIKGKSKDYTEKVVINADTEQLLRRFPLSETGGEGKKIINQRVQNTSPLYKKIIVKNSEGNVLKEWEGIAPDYLGQDVNSPFNYDSWVYKPLNSSNSIGKIIFTITDEDFKN